MAEAEYRAASTTCRDIAWLRLVRNYKINNTKKGLQLSFGVDASLADDKDTRRSRRGYVVALGLGVGIGSFKFEKFYF